MPAHFHGKNGNESLKIYQRVIRSRKLKNGQYNGNMKKANNKIKNNEPQKTKDRATRTALKPGVNPKVTWRG
jgi:hypothetical protein